MDRRGSAYWYLASSRSLATSWFKEEDRSASQETGFDMESMIRFLSPVYYRAKTLMMVAKYSPLMWFSVFMYKSRSSLAPTGLYLALNLSKRWKVCLPFKVTAKSQTHHKNVSEDEILRLLLEK